MSSPFSTGLLFYLLPALFANAQDNTNVAAPSPSSADHQDNQETASPVASMVCASAPTKGRQITRSAVATAIYSRPSPPPPPDCITCGHGPRQSLQRQ